MTVQLFRPRYRTDECLEKIRSVLDSGWTGQGPLCSQFESEFAQFIGRESGLFLNSATAALHLAVKLSGIPDHSIILTTPLTFVSTNHAILYERHTPVFADINPKTLALSYESVVSVIEDQWTRQDPVRAIIWVHHGGQSTEDFRKTMDFLSDNRARLGDIVVIEDCAHAAGGFYFEGLACDGLACWPNASRIGSNSRNFAVFSFQAVKNMPTADSGFLFCPTGEQLQRARKLAWLGIDKSTFSRTAGGYNWKYTVDEIGYKYNANDIMAAIALVQLKYLDQDNSYRKRIAGWYQAFLYDKDVEVIKHSAGSSNHLVNVLHPERDKAMAGLASIGYASGVHYLPNNQFPVYEKFECRDEGLNSVADRVLSLPNHLDLTIEDVKKICNYLNNKW